jgi:hypothetical protein
MIVPRVQRDELDSTVHFDESLLELQFDQSGLQPLIMRGLVLRKIVRVGVSEHDFVLSWNLP